MPAPPPTPLERHLRRIAPLGLIALLDLGTAAIPSHIDVFAPIPPLPGWLRAIEIALALALLPLLPRALRALAALVRALPGAATGKAALLLYLTGALTVVLLRTEWYPFSNVGMFSAVPRATSTATRREPTVAFASGPRFVPLAPLREGSALAASADTGWDYKAGWVMYMFGTTHSRALRHADALARQNGFEGALRVRVVFDPLTGRDLGVEPLRRSRP